MSVLRIARMGNPVLQKPADPVAERLANMSEAEALAALVADGKLVKRPLVLGDDFALVGFDEKAYRAQFR